MTFFNKKTDVIDIELTPYGRYLLSIGKLKPKYYDLRMTTSFMIFQPMVLRRRAMKTHTIEL